MMNENDSSYGTVFLSFALGTAIGVGLALLTAPRSGSETRQKIRGMMDDTRDELQKITEDAEARIKKAVQEGRDYLEKKTD